MQQIIFWRSGAVLVLGSASLLSVAGCASDEAGVRRRPVGGSLVGGSMGVGGFGGGDHFRAVREASREQLAAATNPPAPPVTGEPQHVVYVGVLPDHLPTTAEEVLASPAPPVESALEVDAPAVMPLVEPVVEPERRDVVEPAPDGAAPDAPAAEPGAAGAAADEAAAREVAAMLGAGATPAEVVAALAEKGQRLNLRRGGIAALFDAGVPLETIRAFQQLAARAAAAAE